jgi:hypothetical protein
MFIDIQVDSVSGDSGLQTPVDWVFKDCPVAQWNMRLFS